MSKQEGLQGEALVADYLRNNGFQLVAHGYYCRFGEIDLIAWEGNTLCFIEVKTRTNLEMGLPREYVTPAKQKKLRKTALFYLSEKKLDCFCRFDVAEVYAEQGFDKARIVYLRDAFQ
ncbi:MAG: YraN family protein [Oscillospiraceae bacterium]|nr:YraN family protein [Oscillospiraceae bacterium]MBP3698819.1 YraN family protein [Oscillospiraceae bacterium]